MVLLATRRPARTHLAYSLPRYALYGVALSSDLLTHLLGCQAKSGGDTGKGSFPARAQAAAAKNATPAQGPKAGKGSKA